jgi:hypothetical protein
MRALFLAVTAFASACSPAPRLVDDAGIMGDDAVLDTHDAQDTRDQDEFFVFPTIDATDSTDAVDTFVRDVPPPRDVVDVTRDVIDAACADARVSPYYECFTDCDCGPGSVCASLSGGTMPRVCLPACEVPEDCPLPPGPGFGVVTPICAGAATDHRCHLSGCSVGGGSPACPPGLHCVGAMPGATHGECHPD